MKRLITVLLGALASVAAMVALVIPAAQAAPAAPAQPAAVAQPNDADAHGCPADGVCLYQNAGYSGTFFIFTGPGKYCNLQSLTDGASSVINNRGNRALLYRDKGCSGPTQNVPANSRIENLRSVGFNDKANGIKVF